MTDTIYVALLDEGTSVWRPVPARKVGEATYEILRPADYDADDETWEFPPGSTVICEKKKLNGGEVLAAVRSAGQRRTA